MYSIDYTVLSNGQYTIQLTISSKSSSKSKTTSTKSYTLCGQSGLLLQDILCRVGKPFLTPGSWPHYKKKRRFTPPPSDEKQVIQIVSSAPFSYDPLSFPMNVNRENRGKATQRAFKNLLAALNLRSHLLGKNQLAAFVDNNKVNWSKVKRPLN